MITEILIPLLNANEPEARIASIHALPGAEVTKDSLLFTIETTKAAQEIVSPTDGYFYPVVQEGDTFAVGTKIADISTKKTEPKTIHEKLRETRTPKLNTFGSLRITKPARKLAETLGIEPGELPSGVLITLDMIEKIPQKDIKIKIVLPRLSKKQLIIFGGGGHAKTIIDAVNLINEYSIAGIVDDDLKLRGQTISGVEVLGTRACLPSIYQNGVDQAINCVGGILDINVRIRVYDLLEKNGFSFPILIHPRATVEPSSHLDVGTQILANSYIGSDAFVKRGALVNTNAVISHDCKIGAYTHIAPGVLLAGNVQVGERTLIGMGVTTAIGITIGTGVRIGNSAIILADVPDHAIIQAGSTWTGRAR